MIAKDESLAGSSVQSDDRPYTPRTLAERWGCSEQHIRQMTTRGDLRSFRVGKKLIRIAAPEVARIEALAMSVAPLKTENEAAQSAELAIRAARWVVRRDKR